MPWEVTCVMDQRVEFIGDWLQGECSMAELCRRYDVSRKTGYKFVARYEQAGLDGLKDRLRAPHHHPHEVRPEIQAAIRQARVAHPTWGPGKLLAWLQRHDPPTNWPGASTIGDLLHREGLTVPRRRTHRTPPYSQPFAECGAPNAVWCADFKGWFRTADGKPCYPFTLSDAYSRFLLRCQALRQSDYQAVGPLFEAAFREYGLPQSIRTDNGPPFASNGLGGLSRLAVWWIKLGIMPERIAAGRPEQNGRHERRHRTLKEEATIPPQATRRAQQQAFDLFRHTYNHERPHQALEQAVPASYYSRSERAYPRGVPRVQYPDEVEVRRVRHSGEIRWQGELLYVSELLAGELVGLAPIDDRFRRLYFGPLELARIDCHTNRLIIPKPARRPSR